MIKLTKPYNGKGILLEVGTVITLPKEVEKVMVENGNAEYYLKNSEISNESSSDDPYAMKNAKDMAEIVITVENINELQELLHYEQQNKNRKTVINAINERIVELSEEGMEDSADVADFKVITEDENNGKS